MSQPLKLSVLSPEGAVLSTEAVSVELPGTQGRFEVLKDHASLITSLDPGLIRWRPAPDAPWESLPVSGGFARIASNLITVCAE